MFEYDARPSQEDQQIQRVEFEVIEQEILPGRLMLG
jgi:hypothetical protein